MSSALTFRLGVRADLPRCVSLLWPGDPTRGIPDLPSRWAHGLTHGAFALIEDPLATGPDRIQGFGLSVFVRNEFIDRYFDKPAAGVTADYYRAVEKGEQPYLAEDEIGAANAGDGVNVLVLHFGSRYSDLADPRAIAVQAVIGPSFFFAHGGYKIRSILAETYGPEPAAFMQQGPFNLLCDFSEQSPDDWAHVPVNERPYLVGLRRVWVAGARFFPLSQLFFTDPPRIPFSRTERRVLERALLNESDEETAEALELSVHTVKKAWKSAIARAGDVLPGVIPEGTSPDGVRGREKRRYLLDYLRTHMEEVRPYSR